MAVVIFICGVRFVVITEVYMCLLTGFSKGFLFRFHVTSITNGDGDC
jgi:hypothetical protein